MILFVGQIDRGHRDREAFQEVDYRAMFGPLAKWVAEMDRIERLPEYISRAFHVAMSEGPARSFSHCPKICCLPVPMSRTFRRWLRRPLLPARHRSLQSPGLCLRQAGRY